MAATTNNLALLIDGDNVSAKVVGGLMAEVAKYGTVSVRRIYGDWTDPILRPWKEVLVQHSITPMQQFAYTTGKNATDGFMIIDAMDLLYTSRFSSFCIVSSDSDFTRLAARIREQGVTVYGFGERKTSRAFIAACNEFTYFDTLKMESVEPSKAPQPRRPGSPTLAARPKLVPKPLDQKTIQDIEAAVRKTPSYDGDWVNLAAVGSYLSQLSPDLQARNFGYERLKDFVKASGIVETKNHEMGIHPPIALVRIKEKDVEI
jgi:hypothetical protein